MKYMVFRSSCESCLAALNTRRAIILDSFKETQRVVTHNHERSPASTYLYEWIGQVAWDNLYSKYIFIAPAKSDVTSYKALYTSNKVNTKRKNGTRRSQELSSVYVKSCKIKSVLISRYEYTSKYIKAFVHF